MWILQDDFGSGSLTSLQEGSPEWEEILISQDANGSRCCLCKKDDASEDLQLSTFGL
jgi:hypothetical protein